MDQNNQEFDLEQYEEENKQIVQALIDAEDGACKNASTAGSVMIRKRIRENGFSRRIIPPKQVGNEDLDRLADSELPAIIEDMEADQPPARSMSFNDTPDTVFYRADKFVITFNKVSSGEEHLFWRPTPETKFQHPLRKGLWKYFVQFLLVFPNPGLFRPEILPSLSWQSAI